LKQFQSFYHIRYVRSPHAIPSTTLESSELDESDGSENREYRYDDDEFNEGETMEVLGSLLTKYFE